MATSGDTRDLLARVVALRDEVERSRLTLELASTREARAEREALLDQLDDHVIPRLESIDAPLLAVVGGSTGAGKSTLVNSVLRQEVSRPGVLRPTTTRPVLIHHPEDEAWFRERRVLPSLPRVTGAIDPESGARTLQLAPTELVPPGMAILDAPDIDSVVAANRELAAQLLAAADLWIFVTTAARYADAIPWHLLRRAGDRGTAVAIVLDRVDRPAMAEIKSHLSEMLREQGMGTTPVFAVPEVTLDPNGLVPDEDIERVRSWLHALAVDEQARASIVQQTLDGAVRSIEERVAALVEAARGEREQVSGLAAAAYLAYDEAEEGVGEGMRDGQLLRGEVLARWQEFVGTGEFFRRVERGVARLRDRIGAAVRSGPPPSRELDEALQSGVSAMIVSAADTAAADLTRTWRGTEAGEVVLAGHPGLSRSSASLEGDVERLVRDWQSDVLDIVRSEGSSRRVNARIAAYGVNGVGLFLMLVSFAHTGGVLVAPEVAIAGGTTALAQKVLEAIFGDQAVRRMAKRARELLLERVADLYGRERGRYTALLDGAALSEAQIRRLERASQSIGEVTS
ncbi:GTPase domain-containing protein [Janibacter corallicola]|uniref:GTPase domain-containing protein n=1 Tax=Janibacter corallicola TaxID=415212 RepID=UPI00082E821E|nr:GTPase domain-containing protein [Janibacter corallicola]